MMRRRSFKFLSRCLRTPPYLILFVSTECWNHCKHCWYNERWMEKNLHCPPLTIDELSRIADSIPSLRFLSLTGGEAFLRDDIVEIVGLFAGKTRLHRYEIPTSGFEPERIASLSRSMLESNKHLPFRVDISIDGAEETHDSIRRNRGSHARALRTVRELLRLKKDFAWFDVGIITTLSSENQHEVERIGALVSEINPEGEWMVNITRGLPRTPGVDVVDMEQYRRAHFIIEERMNEGSGGGHSGHWSAKWLSAKNAVRREVILEILAGSSDTGCCAAGTLAGVIYSDGTVMPCEMLDRSIGNLRDYDYDLAALWNSHAADEIRDSIRLSKCSCTHECFLSVSLLANPRYWPRIVRERIKLLRSSRRRP